MSIAPTNDARSEAPTRVPEDPNMIAMVTWVRARIRLRGYRPSMWGDECGTWVTDFLSLPESTRLVAFVAEGRLCFARMETAAGVLPKQFMWFVRRGDPPSPASIAKQVQFGLVNGGGMDALLRVMAGVYVPRVIANDTWPESVRKDFSGQLHRFMASLTETAYQAQGKTVLYLPSEGTVLSGDDVSAAAADKDLVQRLESTVIHWTRQIKEVRSVTQLFCTKAALTTACFVCVYVRARW